ncbi:hypothetical protein R3P38DRAFT_3376989 [Favolaschia claudopus]|uniref:Uncharacterized protein n=1 Tax=Favolaschia claudopus TaxID=2862362 RepID=A0AAV9ZDZ3_9AGAR
MFDVSTGYDGLDGRHRDLENNSALDLGFARLRVVHSGHSAHIRAEIALGKRSINRRNCKSQDSVATPYPSWMRKIEPCPHFTSTAGGIRVILVRKGQRLSKPTCATLIAILVPATALTAHSSKPTCTAAFVALSPPPPCLFLPNLKNEAADVELEAGEESTASELLLRWQPRESTTAGCFLDRDERRRRALIKVLSLSANHVRRARTRSASNGWDEPILALPARTVNPSYTDEILT